MANVSNDSQAQLQLLLHRYKTSECADFHRNLAIFLAILVVISTFGNPVTIYIFCRQKLTPSTLMFMVLAVLDFFLLLLSLFTTVLPNLITDSPQFSDVAVFLSAYLFPVLITIYCMSTWLVVLMALNRYLAITKPLLYHRTTKIKFVCIQLVILFVVSVVFTIPRFFELKVQRAESAVAGHYYYSTYTDLQRNKHYQLYYKIVSHFILLNVLPLAFLLFFTYKLLKEIRRSNERRQEMVAVQSGNIAVDGNRVTFILTTVVVVFIIFHTPVLVYRLMELIFFLRDDGWSCMQLDMTVYGISRICNTCVQINATFNFIIYIISSPPFRKDLMKMFCFRMTTCEIGSHDSNDSNGSDTGNGSNNINHHPPAREENTSTSNVSIIQLIKYSHNLAFLDDDDDGSNGPNNQGDSRNQEPTIPEFNTQISGNTEFSNAESSTAGDSIEMNGRLNGVAE